MRVRAEVEGGLQKYNGRFRQALRAKQGRCARAFVWWWEHGFLESQFGGARKLWNSTGFEYAESCL